LRRRYPRFNIPSFQLYLSNYFSSMIHAPLDFTHIKVKKELHINYSFTFLLLFTFTSNKTTGENIYTFFFSFSINLNNIQNLSIFFYFCVVHFLSAHYLPTVKQNKVWEYINVISELYSLFGTELWPDTLHPNKCHFCVSDDKNRQYDLQLR